MALTTSEAARPRARSSRGSRSTCTSRCLPPYGYGMEAPATVASWVRRMLLPRSKISCSGMDSLDRANCNIGTLEALYDSTNGGVVPGGADCSCVWDTAMIWANDRSWLAFGWKKYLTTASLLTDCDSVCSTSLTTVWAVRSENK